MSRSRSISLTRLLLLMFIVGSALYFVPQTLASIFGTVRGIVHDVQHRPIPGAQIELSAKQSDWRRTAVSSR